MDEQWRQLVEDVGHPPRHGMKKNSHAKENLGQARTPSRLGLVGGDKIATIGPVSLLLLWVAVGLVLGQFWACLGPWLSWAGVGLQKDQNWTQTGPKLGPIKLLIIIENTNNKNDKQRE